MPRRAAPKAAIAQGQKESLLFDGGSGGEALEEEEEEVTGDVGPESLKGASALLARNQAALTTLPADQDSSSSASSTDAMSSKGPGLLLRGRRQFQADPEKPFVSITLVKSSLTSKCAVTLFDL